MGCADPPAVVNAWSARAGDTLTVRCNFSRDVYQLKCDDVGRWVGDRINCSSAGDHSSFYTQYLPTRRSHQSRGNGSNCQRLYAIDVSLAPTNDVPAGDSALVSHSPFKVNKKKHLRQISIRQAIVALSCGVFFVTCGTLKRTVVLTSLACCLKVWTTTASGNIK